MTTGKAVSEIDELGFSVLRRVFPASLIDACRDGFWPILLEYLSKHHDDPNRGPHRHFLPMPFEPPCFDPGFFLNERVLNVVCGVMGDRVVADQWGCDVPLRGSQYQDLHIDYRRPLFPESPELELPAHMLVVSFGLIPVTAANGPIEIVPASHRLRRQEEPTDGSQIKVTPVMLDIGDVLIRHPWALHRGSPNHTETPRALVSIRYVRQWYADASRDVNVMPRAVWECLTPEQRSFMRFPVGE